MNCKRCALPIAYKAAAESTSFYILDGAFVDAGVVTKDAHLKTKSDDEMRQRPGKYSSYSVATTTEQEEAELESVRGKAGVRACGWRFGGDFGGWAVVRG